MNVSAVVAPFDISTAVNYPPVFLATDAPGQGRAPILDLFLRTRASLPHVPSPTAGTVSPEAANGLIESVVITAI